MSPIQISPIQNGFIVAYQEVSAMTQGQPKAVAIYCKDMDAVCALLKQISG